MRLQDACFNYNCNSSENQVLIGKCTPTPRKRTLPYNARWASVGAQLGDFRIKGRRRGGIPLCGRLIACTMGQESKKLQGKKFWAQFIAQSWEDKIPQIFRTCPTVQACVLYLSPTIPAERGKCPKVERIINSRKVPDESKFQVKEEKQSFDWGGEFAEKWRRIEWLAA